MIKRYDVDGLRNKRITSISVNKDGGLWVASDATGTVYLIDPEEAAVIHSYQGADEGIIDAIFSPNGSSLLTMGVSGVINIWGVGD